MKTIERPSPSHNARPEGQAVDILLLHYTGMVSAEAALGRMCDPAAEVSAHYCIDEDGTLHALVPEERRAWHAGRALWGGESDINGRSIGIELVNPGHEFGYRPFPEPQMARLIALASEILDRHPIPPERVLGHSDVAPLRKEDPGELFDWARLAAAGIGVWPDDPSPLAEAPPEVEVHAALTRYGYGYLDEDPAAVLRAFQRHFRPDSVTGEADAETAARLFALTRRPA
ncbi:MAG: N-acetylmuramoyl-L-alanine amidase [Kiloniellales bacterium]|nr:N-acetylmuramoyl-L-alanine amidase [Kiloniellales bacterium]